MTSDQAITPVPAGCYELLDIEKKNQWIPNGRVLTCDSALWIDVCDGTGGRGVYATLDSRVCAPLPDIVVDVRCAPGHSRSAVIEAINAWLTMVGADCVMELKEGIPEARWEDRIRSISGKRVIVCGTQVPSARAMTPKQIEDTTWDIYKRGEYYRRVSGIMFSYGMGNGDVENILGNVFGDGRMRGPDEPPKRDE